MAGISAISMIRFMQTTKSSNGKKDKLSEATKAKLIALGVDITGIVSELEGQMKLAEAQMERLSGSSNNNHKNTENNSVLTQARALAHDLSISYTDNDTVDDLIYKITAKINELKVAAGDDIDKSSKVSSFEKRLDELKNSQLSQLQLNASMNLMSNMNIAFHGLY